MNKTIFVSVGILGLLFFAVAAKSSDGDDSPKEQPLSPEREAFLDAVRSQLGVLYQWGGGRNPKYDYGVDCSGLVISSLWKADLKLPSCGGATSNIWWHCLERISDPSPGDLAFYGDASTDRAIHVEVVESYDGENAVVIGANGGGPQVTSPEIAKEKNAHVRRESSHLHWKKFLGFARLTFDRPIKGFVESSEIPLELQADEVL